VENGRRHLVTALFLSVSYGFVVLHYGRSAWEAWSGLLLGRGLLVTIAALAAMSLANVWARAVLKLKRSHVTQEAADDLCTVCISVERPGEGDV